MVNDKFVLVSMNDDRTKKIADVLGNKTCKKIIDYLADHEEMSAKDLSDGLKIPLNTLDYNMKKLLDSELVKKTKNFFWSKKGKKIVMYELSNKSIVISPKNTKVGSKFKSLFPAALITLAGTFAVWSYEKIKFASVFRDQATNDALYSSDKVMVMASESIIEKAPEIMPKATEIIFTSAGPIWVWFLAGGIVAMLLFALINWRKL